MGSCKFTEFGLCVKTELLKRGLSQRWLEEEVTRKTGMFMDSGYMFKILTGRRNAPKIISTICEILDIGNFKTLQDGNNKKLMEGLKHE